MRDYFITLALRYTDIYIQQCINSFVHTEMSFGVPVAVADRGKTQQPIRYASSGTSVHLAFNTKQRTLGMFSTNNAAFSCRYMKCARTWQVVAHEKGRK